MSFCVSPPVGISITTSTVHVEKKVRMNQLFHYGLDFKKKNMWATWLHEHLVNLKHKPINAFWVFHKIRAMRLISIAKTIQQHTALYIISQFLTTAIIKNNKALHLWLSLSVIKKQSYQLLPQCAFKPTAINGSTVHFTHTERANWQIPTTL